MAETDQSISRKVNFDMDGVIVEAPIPGKI